MRKLMIFLSGLLMAASAFAQNPYNEPDDSWISIDGTVESVTADTFLLDYGDGAVIVEFDDWDNDADAYVLVPGDKVTVYGYIDSDFFEVTSIEASSVYVENINTQFWASGADEEQAFGYIQVATPVVVSATAVSGIVTAVDGREFTLGSGDEALTVDTSALAVNPLDDEGFQQIDVGDRVSVVGTIDNDLFEERKLMADSIVSLPNQDVEDSESGNDTEMEDMEMESDTSS